MLVLTRKLQEKITIAGNITITVLRVKGQTVRIGIEAPREIRVVRGELPMEAAAEESQEEGADATASSPTMKGVTEENSPAATQPQARTRNESRLPQRRKFDRYSQPPLKEAVTSAVALAK
ncbi:MAG: carbon storage regulator [Pirellulaceae bacterium]|nr:carbon storage regulator [Pirellulaceae bacterium]